jgi:hypothetical protein
MKTSFEKFMASSAVQPVKVEMALIDDAKSVDVNFNKYTTAAEIASQQVIKFMDVVLKNLNLAMSEAQKARKVYADIEKSANALGIKPTDIGYSILVNEVIMDSGQWQDLLDTMKIAKSKLEETAFF